MLDFLTIAYPCFSPSWATRPSLRPSSSARTARAAWLVFFAASLALIASTALAVLAGQVAQGLMAALPLKLIAGLGFVAIGAIMIAQHVMKA